MKIRYVSLFLILYACPLFAVPAIDYNQYEKNATLDSDRIQNGYFTKSIIEAIRNKRADRNGDGNVSTDELREYVSEKVAKDTDNLQHPTVDRDNIHQKFGFSLNWHYTDSSYLNHFSINKPGSMP